MLYSYQVNDHHFHQLNLDAAGNKRGDFRGDPDVSMMARIHRRKAEQAHNPIQFMDPENDQDYAMANWSPIISGFQPDPRLQQYRKQQQPQTQQKRSKPGDKFGGHNLQHFARKAQVQEEYDLRKDSRGGLAAMNNNLGLALELEEEYGVEVTNYG